jgi:hypothetical protein
MYVPTPFTPPSSTIIATTTEAAMLAQTSPYPRAPLNYNVPVAIRLHIFNLAQLQKTFTLSDSSFFPICLLFSQANFRQNPYWKNHHP